MIEGILMEAGFDSIEEALILEKEKYFVVTAMTKYGGSFSKNLGAALNHADLNNTMKIKRTWAQDWQEYLEMGKIMEGKADDR